VVKVDDVDRPTISRLFGTPRRKSRSKFPKSPFPENFVLQVDSRETSMSALPCSHQSRNEFAENPGGLDSSKGGRNEEVAPGNGCVVGGVDVEHGGGFLGRAKRFGGILRCWRDGVWHAVSCGVRSARLSAIRGRPRNLAANFPENGAFSETTRPFSPLLRQLVTNRRGTHRQWNASHTDE
jgi:hypothetical protein